MPNVYGATKVFATNSARHMADLICNKLSIKLSEARVARFKDDEVDVQILEDVRGRDVYIVTALNAPAENFFEALWLASAAKKSSASRVTFVITYMGYARSDRKSAPRMPIGIKLAFDILSVAKPDRMLVLDIHAEQSLPLVNDATPDHLFASIVLVPVLQERLRDTNFVITSPDIGGAVRALAYARLLGKNECVIISKNRPEPGEVDEDSIMIVGKVKGRLVVFVDDMIDSGGTMLAGAKAVVNAGATGVIICVTHALFSGNAQQKLQDSEYVDTVYVTDSINTRSPEEMSKYPKITTVTVSGLLAQAIQRTHDDQSLSELIL